jgi:hypothetical protein
LDTANHGVGPTGTFNTRVRDQEYIVCAQIPGVASGQVKGAQPEYNFRGNKFSKPFHHSIALSETMRITRLIDPSCGHSPNDILS